MASEGWRSIRGMKDWETGLEEAIGALNGAEKYFFGDAASLQHRHYKRAGRMFVASDLLGKLASDKSRNSILKRVLAAGSNSNLVTRVSLLKSPRYELPCNADVVLLKANLRGFYLNDGITIKIPNPGRASAEERFRHEISMRLEMKNTNRVSLPELIQDKPPTNPVFLAEKLLPAGTSERRVQDDDLACWLLDFYVLNGLQARLLSDHFKVPGAWQTIGAYCMSSGIEVPKRLANWVQDFCARGAIGNAEVWCAPCNGDLTKTNLIFQDKHVNIVDWEYLSEAPVCTDAIKLSTQIPQFHSSWFKAMTTLSLPVSDQMLSVRDQFVVAALKVIVERLERQYDFIGKGGRAAYRDRMKRRVKQIIQLVDTLLGEAH